MPPGADGSSGGSNGLPFEASPFTQGGFAAPEADIVGSGNLF
jgi:hypothetical protein